MSLGLPSALRSRVSSIDVVDQPGEHIQVLPGLGAVMGFQLRGGVLAGSELLSPAGVTGVQSAAREYSYLPGTLSVLVRFTPQGAACLGVPASELTDRSVPLDALLPGGQELRERLVNAADVRHAVGVLEAWLLSRPFAPDRLVMRAFTLLEQGNGKDAQIAAVARELGLSERQLERRMLARTGVTPKHFASVRRFERALAALRAGAGSLAQVAVAAGYYDQSHFYRDFRRFTGTTPARYVRAAR
jgi:AraC-like DNA-binding protein